MNHQAHQPGQPEEKPESIAHEPGDEASIENPEIEHEYRDVNIRPIVLFAASLAVLLSVVGIGLWFGLNYLANREATGGVPSAPLLDVVPRQPPTVLEPEVEEPADFPGLQAAPQRDWQEMLAAENELLTRYEWIDQDAGVARIPIDRAMELLLERGLPVREEADLPADELDQAPGLEAGDELESEGGHELEEVPEPPIVSPAEPER